MANDKHSLREFESEHPGYCGAQDTFYVGNMKGVGRIYQQTFVDTYSKVTFATKTKSPQTNGIVERFHRTVLNEFYRLAFRKKLYHSIDELQADLDLWLDAFNRERPHQGRWCFGKTPMQTFLDAKSIAKEKMIAA